MLKEKLIKNKAVVGVFGLGYIGLPRAIHFASAKVKVIGFDIDKKKIDYLKKGKSYLSSVKSGNIKKALKNKFESTSDVSRVSELDVIVLCLPTPLKGNNLPDLSFIKKTLSSIKNYLKKDQMICFESTTYPGTTEEIILPFLKKKKFDVGKDFFLIYSPERDDPGRVINNSKIPRVYCGLSKKCSELGKLLYKKIFDKMILVSDIKTAEMTKLYENIYRSINIGLVNEMKKICDKMGLKIFDVINAAKSKPYGFNAFYPGPGLGGHCIPIDPFYLSWKARQYNINTKFIELAGKINRSMPKWIIQKTFQILKKKKKKTNLKILVLGVAYKKNINDCRESPAFEIIKRLMGKRVIVKYNDPYIHKIPKLRNYDFKMESIKLNKKILQSFDATIIVTNHDNYDYEMIRKNSLLVIDTRNSYKKEYKNIYLA
jgi:UDP-N-acetyl-D-glucosamine dehydrogenase